MSATNERRSFLKKSLAVSIAATTPGFLNGVLFANGGGGAGSNFSKSIETTDVFLTTIDETFIWDTTIPSTGFDTTIAETTLESTAVGGTTLATTFLA